MRQFLRQYLKPAYLPLMALCTGVLGMLMRVWLLVGNTDEKGLLIAGHIADPIVWILSAAVVIVLIIGTLDLKEANKYRFNFPASPIGAIGSGLAALGIFISSIAELKTSPDAFTVISAVLGFLSAASLLFTGWCRMKGSHPAFYFHAIVCIYMMIHLVCHYRQWSSDPQLQDYAFQLLALVFLMLACYQRSAFDAGIGSRRSYTLFSLSAFYFCIVCLPGCDNLIFFLGCGLWMMTNLCSLTPLIAKSKEG